MAILPFQLILIIEQGKDEAKPVFSEFMEIIGKAAMLMQININSKRGVVIKALPCVVRLLVAASGSGFRGGNWNNNATNLHVSNRNNAANTNANRNNNYGFRSANTYCLFLLPSINPYLKSAL
jgi:hypothetical protein